MKALIAVVLLASAPTLAVAGEPSKQTHHCKMPDGTMDMNKTKKECKAAKGTWAKDTAAAGDESKAAGGTDKGAKPDSGTAK